MLVLKKSFLPVITLMLVILLLALAGCGSPTATVAQSSAGQSPAVARIDACSLLTKADAEQVLGKAVDEPTHPIQSEETFLVDSCEYRMTGATAKEHAILTIVAPANGDLETALKTFATGKQGAQAAYPSTLPDLPGLGDSAYWVGGEGNSLMMMKGIMTVSLSVSTQKGEAPSQAMLDLGKLVLGRLP